MKIAILGYSGSGKSSLAAHLAKKHSLPLLHLDTVQFLPDWEIRSDEEKTAIIKDFLDKNDAWVIDGNYSRFFLERRLLEADLILLLLFNRVSCLYRVLKRYRLYRNKSRPDMTEGCKEKIDREFLSWVWHQGRTGKKKAMYKAIAAQYSDKVKIAKNQRQLSALYEEC